MSCMISASTNFQFLMVVTQLQRFTPPQC